MKQEDLPYVVPDIFCQITSQTLILKPQRTALASASLLNRESTVQRVVCVPVTQPVIIFNRQKFLQNSF
jgi:hypothetical protein